MKTNVTIKVTNERQLSLPLEIQSQLQPGDEYRVIVTENSIVLEKIPQSIDLDEFLQKIEQIEPDPNQPTLEEISDIVKEVRQEIWTNK